MHSGNQRKRGHTRLPLANFPVVRTDDEEEGRQAVCRIYHEVNLERTSRRRLGFTGNHVHFNGWGISYAKYHGGFELFSAPSSGAFIVQFCTAGAGQTRYGKNSVDLSPGGAAAVVSPGERPGWSFGDDFAHMIVKIEQTTLEAHLRAVTGYAGHDLEFDPAAPAEGAFAAPLLRLVQFIVSELDQSDTLLRSPVVLAEFENAIFNGMLERQPHSLSRLWTERAPEPSTAYVRKAEELLVAHLGRPLRMSKIADEVGVSLRSLQKAFQRLRGQTLTQFLRSARLDLARKRLAAGVPGTTVTDVALDCGFAHFGKFAAYYRTRFGERPSETLAKAQVREAR